MIDTLSCLAAIKIDNKLWCSNLNFNALYKIDLSNNQIEYVGRFIDYDEQSVGLHRFACSYKNKIIFFPQYACSVDSYDMYEGFKTCKLKHWRIEGRTSNFPKTAGTFEWNDKFYIFPRYKGMNLLVFDPEENKIVKEIELHLANSLFTNDDVTMSFNCVRVNNMIYMPILGTNHIVTFDFESMRESYIDLPLCKKINGAIGYSTKRFIIHCDNSIKLFDFKLNELLQSYECLHEGEGRVTDFMAFKSKIMAIPSFLGTLKIIDFSKNLVEECSVDMSYRMLKSGVISHWHHLERCIECENEFILLPIGINSGIKYDYSVNAISEYKCVLTENSLPSIKLNPINIENEKIGLKELIRTLK